ncbi:MAG: hypothetical protein HYR89_04360 [Actinobacteria bacterium]|nr:hypothetical protein [Actinomycetota bacterium]
MLGSFLQTLAGKVALAGLGGMAAMGTLGAAGALPGPFQVAFGTGMRAAGITAPVNHTDTSPAGPAEPSIGSATTLDNESETTTVPPGTEPDLLDPMLLELGIDIAFAGEPTADAAYEAAKAHIDNQCSHALEALTERFAVVSAGTHDGTRQVVGLERRMRDARADIMTRCTRALAHAEHQRAMTGDGPSNVPGAPPLGATPDPTAPAPRHGSPPGPGDTSDIPRTPGPGDGTPPVAPTPLPETPFPSTPLPETPSTEPPTPEPDLSDPGPGSGWDWVDGNDPSEGLSTPTSGLQVQGGDGADRTHPAHGG